jgi:hypothetical protein
MLLNETKVFGKRILIKKIHPLRRAYINLLLEHRDAKMMIVRLKAISGYCYRMVTGQSRYIL